MTLDLERAGIDPVGRELAELSALYPEMRIGQILNWFAGAARGQRPESIYDAEDAELIQAMRAHLDKHHAVEQGQK